ncbi:DUF4258 domain-containing protein [uncultured Kriegella sp.]|uniref:DUF4258 domain-containing protein n=1 Tax=uncultured Kriegella sp. TaxID=1798910 RepID=UPI0030DA3769|tara:strand:- start:188231 stop:188614 length:384 start_codon:yes stop_codon:yes gene_type:complete
MDFLKRLGFYMIGLAIGIVFLAFFLKKKSAETGTEFCYFPNCRTLKDIRSKPLSYSEEIKAMIETKELDSLDITSLLTGGDVDFRRSDTKSKGCKTYFIEGELKGEDVILKVKNCPNKALAEQILAE